MMAYIQTIELTLFKRGTLKGLKTTMPEGGQILPISTLGDKLLWKKAQKNEKKNKTSEVIKKITPQRSPLTTILVWSPWNVPSREISRHHWYITKQVEITPKINKDSSNLLNHLTNPTVNIIALREPVRGHGLISTRWYVWCPCDDVIS